MCTAGQRCAPIIGRHEVAAALTLDAHMDVVCPIPADLTPFLWLRAGV